MSSHHGDHSHGHRQRRYFLNDVPLDQALEGFFTALREIGALDPKPGVELPLSQAQGRITARPVWALTSSPHYDAAAMDGAAVRAADTLGATETSPVNLTIGDQAVLVDTGDPMPAGYNAVVMIEHLHRVDDNTLQVSEPVPPWQHVRPLGEDLVATELVLPENHQIRPVDLGACAAAGVTQLHVRRRPKVAVLPTGNELVPPGTAPLKPGDVVEFNSLMISGMIDSWGGEWVVLPSAPDEYETIKAAVSSGLSEFDLVIVNAGSSAGAEDYTASVVEDLGRLLVHGVAVRPGHPVVLGMAEGKPIIGLPGYPVSAVLTAELFVKPLIERWLGRPTEARPTVTAELTRKVLSPLGEDEYLRVKLGRVGDRMVATPLQRGAGVIMSLVRADGIAQIPRFSEGLDAGSPVEVQLLRPLGEVQNTIVAIGSHDLTLDLIASHLSRRQPGLGLSSSHVGSLGGLIALRRGEAHIAGCHLLDEATGEYNVSYIQRYLPSVPLVLMNLVGRVQGLIVPTGNPKGIRSLEDLGRPGVVFVNRQRGSGTRVLLDYKLAGMSLDAEGISGYDREEYSHLAVAAAVASGSADTGLGILSAARALGLDFLPLLTERYDLVVPREHFDSELLQPLINLLQDSEFRREVESLGGYETGDMGKIMWETGNAGWD
jgi:putative molybdopterin biosynthesis protein